MVIHKNKVIAAAAREARRWAEKEAMKFRYGSDLGGLCAYASAHLFKILRKKGLRPVLVTNLGHCYVRVNRKIVDVTATQFGSRFRKVEILPCNTNKGVLMDEYGQNVWKAVSTYRSVTALRRNWSRDLM